MPNKHAAEKDLRKNHKRAAKNSRMKTHIKALTARFQGLLEEGKRDEASKMAMSLQQILDKASKNHLFHGNRSQRKVSAVHRALNKPSVKSA